MAILFMVALVNVEILLFVLKASEHWEGLLFCFFFLIYIYIYSSQQKHFCGINMEVNICTYFFSLNF